MILDELRLMEFLEQENNKPVTPLYISFSESKG